MSSSESFFALIIGINKYDYHPDGFEDLSYAVSDATSVRDFLVDKLQVPEDNIHLVLDGKATHDNIINSIRSHLTNNPAIRPGDPILFYYAGHGARYPAPPEWPTDDGECEALCPADRQELENGDEEAERDRPVGADILDRTLGALFAELAGAKGDNVWVVMDCCHSGSITRGVRPDVEGLRTRRAHPIKSKAVQAAMFTEAMRMTSTITTDGGTRGLARTVAKNHLYDPYGGSHVLLSACRQDEEAAEWSAKESGVFTHSLLEVLGNTDLTRLTYAALRDTLDFPLVLQGMQTPQCEGENRHRILFNGKALGANTRMVPIGLASDRKLRVEAGAIHGVVPGTEFAVWSNQLHNTGQDTGKVVATEVFGVWSIVKPVSVKLPISPGSYVIVSYWANRSSPFHIGFSSNTTQQQQQAMRTRIENVSSDAATRGDIDVYIKCVDAAVAKTSASIVEGEVTLERTDKWIVEANCPKVFKWPSYPGHDEWALLNLVARFNFHLYRENPTHPLRDFVSVSLRQIDEEGTLGDKDHINEGRADLPHDEDGQYALILKNGSDVNLWCSLYYFDPSDYGVTMMYAPSSANMLPPLKRGCELVIGHGSSNVRPFSFTVDADSEIHDAGFMKLFISEEFADLAMVEQEAGFSYVPPDDTRGGLLPQANGEWDTLVTIIDVHSSKSPKYKELVQ